MSCLHPPITEVSQLLICRKCHAAKVEGVLRFSALLSVPTYFLGATSLDMLVDPALIGKRVRVTIEALPDETIVAKEVVTDVS